jgi:DNA-binding transcriptional MerR regulator
VNGAGRPADGPADRPRRPVPFPDDTAPLYTVGQVADMLGVQPAFLRRLDVERAVSPSRSPGGQRRYSRLEIDHIDTITGLLDEGMTVAGAKRIMELQAEIAELRRQLGQRPTR